MARRRSAVSMQVEIDEAEFVEATAAEVASAPEPGTAIMLVEPRAVPAPVQADSDKHLVQMWLNRHASPHTRRNYERQANRFLTRIAKPLNMARVGDLQEYVGGLDGSPATRAVATSAIKSLISFGQEVGYLRFNIGAAVKAPPIKNVLAERILTEMDVLRMIGMETAPRARALLCLLYGGGLRISEACGLRWRDLVERDATGQATVFGKGGKTRVVLFSPNTWRLLMDMKGEAEPSDPVLSSRKSGLLDPSTAHRIVKEAARRAGLPAHVSAHWLRHAHASHALDRQAPIHLVQATLGHSSVATTGRYLHARPSESSSRFLSV